MYKVLNFNIKQSSPKLHKLLNIWGKLFNEVNFYLRRKFVFRWTSFKESKINNNKTNHLIKRNYLEELNLEWREVIVWKKTKKILFQIWTEKQISKKEFKKLCLDYDNWDNPWISYEDLYKEVKEISKNYPKLPPQVSQVGGFWTSLRSFKIPLSKSLNNQSIISLHFTRSKQLILMLNFLTIRNEINLNSKHINFNSPGSLSKFSLSNELLN